MRNIKKVPSIYSSLIRNALLKFHEFPRKRKERKKNKIIIHKNDKKTEALLPYNESYMK